MHLSLALAAASLCALLPSGIHATWKFCFDGRFESSIHVKHYLVGNTDFPMAFDNTHDEVFRVIPKGTTHPDHEHEEVYANYKRKNILQVFNPDLSIKHRRQLVPNSSWVTNLGVYNVTNCPNECSSTSTSSSSCSSCSATSSTDKDSSWSSSDCCEYRCRSGEWTSRLVSTAIATPAVEILEYPCLKEHCTVPTSDGLVKVMDNPANGEVWLLYPDHFQVFSPDCVSEYTSPLGFNFNKTDHNDAVDFDINFDENLMIVMFPGALYAVVELVTYSVVDFDYVFGAPIDSTFRLQPSAMSLDTPVDFSRITTRLYVFEGPERGLYILYFDYQFTKMAPLQPRLQVAKATEKYLVQNGPCQATLPTPAVVADYLNEMDIAVQVDPTGHYLNFFVSKYSGPSELIDQVEFECSDLKLCDCLGDNLVAGLYNAKDPEANVFYVTLTPSLDVLRISYVYINDVVTKEAELQ